MSAPPDYPDDRYSAAEPAGSSFHTKAELSDAQLREVEAVLRHASALDQSTADEPAFSKVSEARLREAELLLRCAAFADLEMATALRRNAAKILSPYLNHDQHPEYHVTIGTV